MIFRDGRYMPPVRNADGVVGFYTPDTVQPVQDERGLYYREHDTDLAAIIEAYRGGEIATAEMPVDIFQAYVDQGWKTPHSSQTAVERLGRKLDEELIEAHQELHEYQVGGSEASRKAVLSELGDLAWLTAAAASNSGAVLDRGIKHCLFRYLQAPQFPDSSPSTWREPAALAVGKGTSLTVSELDALLVRGFSPDMDDDPEFITDALLGLAADVMALKGRMYSQRDDADGRYIITSTAFMAEAQEAIAPLAANIFLRLGAIAHSIGGTLSEVIEINMQKVSGRVEAGLVDKDDGARPPELH